MLPGLTFSIVRTELLFPMRHYRVDKHVKKTDHLADDSLHRYLRKGS